MSRTISQIYSEAVYVRNNYLQITQLNSGRTSSKMSILNLMTYVMAVLIYTYEAVLDAFQVNIAKLILKRINGTAEWYVTMAYKFQYNSLTNLGDPFSVNEDTFALEYETVDQSHRIITKAAWQEYLDDSIVLKVCKKNIDQTQIDNGMLYAPLEIRELNAFKSYIKAIKFIGSKIYCTSIPGDIITVKTAANSPIYYNGLYSNAEGVLESIRAALVAYAASLDYNGAVYYQSIIDVIQRCENVVSIGAGITVQIKSYDPVLEAYGSAQTINGRYVPKSGFVGFIDSSGNSTITFNNIQLVASE